MTKNPRWGRVSEIDKRTRVGSKAWMDRHSTDIQHLSAYRKLHQLADHQEVRNLVDASVEEKLNAIKDLENGKK
jgi:hypothetical protein